MRTSTKAFIVGGLLVAILLAGVVSRFASDEPDGLEKVSADEGFDGAADDHALEDSPVADYEPAASGLLGVLVTFGIGAGVFALVRRRREPTG
jgi:cobalt/nickel transport system permease protein